MHGSGWRGSCELSAGMDPIANGPTATVDSRSRHRLTYYCSSITIFLQTCAFTTTTMCMRCRPAVVPQLQIRPARSGRQTATAPYLAFRSRPYPGW